LTAEDNEPAYWQDTEEGKAWADYAYKLYQFREYLRLMAYYDQETLEESS
jgi:hypothetical protein